MDLFIVFYFCEICSKSFVGGDSALLLNLSLLYVSDGFFGLFQYITVCVLGSAAGGLEEEGEPGAEAEAAGGARQGQGDRF